MAADRADACALPADMAAQQGEIGQLLNVLRAAPMLGDAHAIDDDRALGFHVDLRGIFDLFATEPRVTLDIRPRRGAQVTHQFIKASGVISDEIPVQNGLRASRPCRCVFIDQNLHEALDHRDVTADPHLIEARADLRRAGSAEPGSVPVRAHGTD